MLNKLDDRHEADLDAVFKALADKTRRRIVSRLLEGEASVSELAGPHDMSLAAISRHLKILTDAGLLDRIRDGKTIRCRLNVKPMRDVSAWAEYHTRFWEQKLASLDQFFEEEGR